MCFHCCNASTLPGFYDARAALTLCNVNTFQFKGSRTFVLVFSQKLAHCFVSARAYLKQLIRLYSAFHPVFSEASGDLTNFRCQSFLMRLKIKRSLMRWFMVGLISKAALCEWRRDRGKSCDRFDIVRRSARSERLKIQSHSGGFPASLRTFITRAIKIISQ